MNCLLRAEGLTRRFGGLVAVDGVSLAVAAGEIRGVIGPNGAGKTTLFNLLTGLMLPTAGRIWLDESAITGRPLYAMPRCGVARTFQNLQLCQGLSVLDNVLLGTHHLTRAGVWGAALRLGWVRREEAWAREMALSALAKVGLAERAGEAVGGLSFGHRKLVEIARALAAQPRLLLLDEPAAGLNQKEKQDLVVLIRTIRAEGITVLLVEHDMRLVMGLCDQIAVLDYGRKIADGTPEKVQSDPAVIQAYLGVQAEAGEARA